MANRFSLNPLGGYDPVEGRRAAEALEEDKQNKLLAAQQRQKLTDAMAGAATGDVAAIDAVFALNPKLGSQYEQRFLQREKSEGIAASKAKKEAELSWAIKYKRAIDNNDEDIATELITQAEANPLVDFDSSMIGKDKRQDQFVVNTMLYNGLGKDGYKALVGDVGGEGGADLPAEAIAFNDLIKDMSPPQQKQARLVKAGLKGRAMSNATLSAIESGDIGEMRQVLKDMKQEQKFAELTGSSRAKAIDKGFETIVKIDTGIRNIDKAIRVLNDGAGVGAVEKLWPSIRSASVELDNIRGQMALDVVGATTFGALSKGELDLAKDVALPTGLDTAELQEYLSRKKVAQEKLRAYYNEQIQFLDQGGTIAGFLRMKESGQQNQDQVPPNAAAPPQQPPNQNIQVDF